MTVDDEQLYLAEDAMAAVVHAEHLEALRCVLEGLTGEMTDGELSRAVAVAEEMSWSALRTISSAGLTDERRQDVEQSLARLREAQEQISLIKRERVRSPPNALH